MYVYEAPKRLLQNNNKRMDMLKILPRFCEDYSNKQVGNMLWSLFVYKHQEVLAQINFHNNYNKFIFNRKLRMHKRELFVLEYLSIMQITIMFEISTFIGNNLLNSTYCIM